MLKHTATLAALPIALTLFAAPAFAALPIPGAQAASFGAQTVPVPAPAGVEVAMREGAGHALRSRSSRIDRAAHRRAAKRSRRAVRTNGRRSKATQYRFKGVLSRRFQRNLRRDATNPFGNPIN